MWIAAYGQAKHTIRDNKMLMWQYTDKAYGVTDRNEIYQIPYKNAAANTNVVNSAVNNKQNNTVKQSNNESEMYVEVKTFTNGSTRENIWTSNAHKVKVGYLDPGEKCECLGVHNGHAIVKYVGSDGYDKVGFTESKVWPGCIK